MFAYGDVDGKQVTAKLQHPLDVAFNREDNCIYVADTYNHKIKQIDAVSNECQTVNIKYQNSDVKYSEPGGLCCNPNGTKLYVADTNNHRIEILSLETRSTETLILNFNTLDATQPSAARSKQLIRDNPIHISPDGGHLNLLISLNCNDDNLKFTKDAPQKWKITTFSKANLNILKNTGTFSAGETISILIDLPELNESHQIDDMFLQITFNLNLCSGDVCFPKVFTMASKLLYSTDSSTNVAEKILITFGKDFEEFISL